MNSFNIYMTGVGGQGIGLLSQTLLRGIDHAGIPAMAVDTHGLAQRGGAVVSRIRCGKGVHSPLIMAHQADLVLAMEVHEAMRGLMGALKKEGTLVFLDVSWQPMPVRLNPSMEITGHDVVSTCQTHAVAHLRVDVTDLPDSQMQNMALLGTIAKHKLVPGVKTVHYVAALKDLLPGPLLETNLDIFNTYAGKQSEIETDE